MRCWTIGAAPNAYLGDPNFSWEQLQAFCRDFVCKYPRVRADFDSYIAAIMDTETVSLYEAAADIDAVQRLMVINLKFVPLQLRAV